MEPFVKKEQEYYCLEPWANRFPHLIAGFTTKNGGFSKDSFSTLNIGFHVHDRVEDVCDNRRLLATKLGVPITSWVGAEQTHESHIQWINSSDQGKGSLDYASSFEATDGFMTNEHNILLTLCYADCVPLYFLHPDTKTIGIAHAGWKGTVKDIAGEMIRHFQSKGIRTEEILAAIGPSICKKCYIVDNRVIQLVQNKLEECEKNPYTLLCEDQYSLDLKECNKILLLQSGILEGNLSVTDLCTSCDQNDFFSHRRDLGNTGRMMSFIGWKEDFL